jgi:uncharacterized damage-inducible protein DinB
VLVEHENSVTTWEQLIDIRTKLRDASRQWLNDTPDDKLHERTTKVWEAGGESLLMSIGECLTHLTLHERGHHGDVSTLLYQLGAEAPANDYAVYLWFKQRRR